MTDPRSRLPSVDRLLQDPAVNRLLEQMPRTVVVDAVRAVLEDARADPQHPPADWGTAVSRAARERMTPSLRRVLNATGVVLHTNLGRAPLARAAVAAMDRVAAGYSSLEYDLAEGARGSRTAHCAGLLTELTGAADALVVNNAAGALVLALNAVAQDREVVISRGELIEIGGSFRIPDVMSKSGARLREIGTTNRTHLKDYADAVGEQSGAILTVHRSNFELRGFVTTPQPRTLAALAADHDLPYVYDVGSGLLADLSPWGLTGEPRVPDALALGAGLVIFSGDKLLGGPQAGCLVGSAKLIDRCRGNPLARALRADKLSLSALEATLGIYRDPDRARREIPVLRMLTLTPAHLAELAADLAAQCPASLEPALVGGESTVGGGAFPGSRLATTLVALTSEKLGATELARRMRLDRTPVVARVADGRVLLDPRTLPADSLAEVGANLARVVAP